MSEVVNSLIQELDNAVYSPPHIALGQFERVGSTFYLDQLERDHIVHNEPYKLLLPNQWPISRNHEGRLQSIDEFCENPDIQEADKHWFRNFVLSLHVPGGQVVKETNLYLVLPQFLECFPNSDISILSRNPAGIASSFKRNGLFDRWGYGKVAETVSAQLDATRPPNYEAMREMVAERDPWHTQLAWMIGLNAVLLSRHVPLDKITEIVKYEEDIVPEGQKREVRDERSSDSIFSTNINKTHDDFEYRFSQEELDELNLAMQACAKFVEAEFDDSDKTLFSRLYSRHIEDKRVSRTGQNPSQLGSVTQATEKTALVDAEIIAETEPRVMKILDEAQDIVWDNSLVTNKQIVSFLQELIEAGLDPGINHMFLLDSMPTTRGGRINFDSNRNTFTLAESFENHPAYWVSWLANALFAYREGMRLPTYDEWAQVFSKIDPKETTGTANHSYMHDDATPTGIDNDGIPVDFFGNLRIWCADWADQIAVSKKLAGISWKNELHDDYRAESQRPYLTNSRIIGARLVTDRNNTAQAKRPISDVMIKIDEIMALIKSTSVDNASDLSELNKKISDIAVNYEGVERILT